MRSGYRTGVDGQKSQNENDDQNIAGASICSMRIEFNLRHLNSA